jgi:hypothetical protein
MKKKGAMLWFDPVDVDGISISCMNFVLSKCPNLLLDP